MSRPGVHSSSARASRAPHHTSSPPQRTQTAGAHQLFSVCGGANDQSRPKACRQRLHGDLTARLQGQRPWPFAEEVRTARERVGDLHRAIDFVLEGDYCLVRRWLACVWLEKRGRFLPRQNGASDKRPVEGPEPANDAHPAAKLNQGFGRARDATRSRRQLEVTLGLCSLHAVLSGQLNTRLLTSEEARQLAFEVRDRRLGRARSLGPNLVRRRPLRTPPCSGPQHI
eukprot:2901714-Prymnesium_polylepis.1